MNEKLKEFAAQAGFNLSWDYHCCDYELERFAELVRQDEREACAKLCLELVQAKASGESYEDGTIDCAEAIRARGNHEQTR